MFKRHDKILKIAVISVTIVVALVVFNIELDNQRDVEVLVESQRLRDIELAKDKHFYDCILAAAAIADENSPRDEQLAAVLTGDEFYERYR